MKASIRADSWRTEILAKFHTIVKGRATIDARCSVNYLLALSFRDIADNIVCIQAWASALPSDYSKAMREASVRRTVTDTDSYAFLF